MKCLLVTLLLCLAVTASPPRQDEEEKENFDDKSSTKKTCYGLGPKEFSNRCDREEGYTAIRYYPFGVNGTMKSLDFSSDGLCKDSKWKGMTFGFFRSVGDELSDCHFELVHEFGFSDKVNFAEATRVHFEDKLQVQQDYHFGWRWNGKGAVAYSNVVDETVDPTAYCIGEVADWHQPVSLPTDAPKRLYRKYKMGMCVKLEQ